MIEQQTILDIDKSELVGKVREQRAAGARLVQVGCVAGEKTEINYSFDLRDKKDAFVNFRIRVAAGEEVPSITEVYWNAFTYENEIHDLFGINVVGNVLDFKGNFYDTAVPTPFAFGASAPAGKE